MPGTTQLYVIGLGIKIPDHVTVEATAAMAACNCIYTVIQEKPALWLPRDTTGQIPVINLLEAYTDGAIRTENYDRAANSVFQAIEPEKTVGYVTYGNPMSYDSVAQGLVRLATGAGTSFTVVPGISSVDTILCDLGVDMAPALQVYEASWLYASGSQLRTDAAALLLQISAFGSWRANYHSRPQGSSLSSLVEYLCRTYPPDLEVCIARSAGLRGQRRNALRIELQNLCEIPTSDLLNASLYIPAFSQPAFDEAVLKQML